MCVGKITNPDVLADCFDAFDPDEDAPDVSTVSQFLNQPDCQVFDLDQDVAA